MSYGLNFCEHYGCATYYVDGVYKARTQATYQSRYQKHLNSSSIVPTAKSLGLAVPQTLLARRRGNRIGGDFRCWQRVLQNSQNAERLIFREKTKQATIANQCSLKPVTGIASEFGARRRSPPHNYSIVAPTARRIRAAAKRLLQHYRRI
jgi:hypothetical protein